MRILLWLLVVLAPAAAAQPADSSATPHAVAPLTPPERSETIAASVLGGLGGTGAGTIAAYAVMRPKIFDDTQPIVYSAMAGLAVGAAAAAALRRDRSFLRALGGAAVGQAVGFGVGLLLESTTGNTLGYLAMPAGAAFGAERSTR